MLVPKLIIFSSILGSGFGALSVDGVTKESRRIKMVVELIRTHYKNHGWNVLLSAGDLPDEFYQQVAVLPFAVAITNGDTEDQPLANIVPYHSNTIVLDSRDFQHFEALLTKIVRYPYWHPRSNIILYYHSTEDRDIIANIFYSFYFYKAYNAIILQYDDEKEHIIISDYNTFVGDKFKMAHNFGCWRTKKIGKTINSFRKGFTCVDSCRNVTGYTKLRANHLGACIGFQARTVKYGDYEYLRTVDWFYNKAENLHNASLMAYGTHVVPFFRLKNESGSFVLDTGRDTMLWNTMKDLMNFTIDLTPSLDYIKKNRFDFETSIEQIYFYANRKADLFVLPLYQMDYTVVELDLTTAYAASGICFLSRRSELETQVFNQQMFRTSSSFLIKSSLAGLAGWFTFILFSMADGRPRTWDQIGKDFMNLFRNIILFPLLNPPKRKSFRIYLGLSMWVYFIVSFSAQASITSFFTAAKRGKEVDTYEDIIEKGYKIEGIPSPDTVLPETDERFRKINTKRVSIPDFRDCVLRLKNITELFCLIDCSMGQYIERNYLTEKGERYLHVARKDRLHSHYLNIVFPRHSLITEQFNKLMIKFVEGGFVKKWEAYKYVEKLEESSVKPLGMDDLGGMFWFYIFNAVLSIICFTMELILGRLH